jgi:AcrR family transcriptional regulator
VTPDTYHHGDLANALRAAAADLLGERGVAGFSLREVARRAEVSHAAPAHHFGDARGLLTAVAVEAFQHLAQRTERAAAEVDDPVAALAQVGRAYVELAVERPGHCSIVFRSDAVDTEDPEYQRWGAIAYGVLHRAVQRVAEERNPGLDVPLAASLCWAAMQGIVVLHEPISKMAALHDGRVDAIGTLAERVTTQLVAGIAPERR